MGKKEVDLSLFKPDKIISAHRNRIKKVLWFFVSALFFQSVMCPFSGVKVFLLRMFGAKIGGKVNIKPGVYVKYPWRLVVGNNVWIGEKTWIANEASVTIGSNVCISNGVLILTAGHNYKKEAFDVFAHPINIEDGAWLAAQSSVTGGVTVGSHAVLSLKSAATKSLEPFYVYRGNPAVKIKERIIV